MQRRRNLLAALGAILCAIASGWMLHAQQPAGATPGGVMSGRNLPWTPAEPARFVGSAEIQSMPLPPGDIRVSRVRHAAGATSNWHVHKGGQILYIESGRGLVQKWGGPVETFAAGDVVHTAPGEKHWHGAAPDSPMTLVAMSVGATEWLERVQREAAASPAAPAVAQPFVVGNPLGLPIVPSATTAFQAMSTDVKVHGAVFSAESCSYDETRGLIVVPSRGVPQTVRTNDAFVSLINHDGSVHTARWIGVQAPAERQNLSPPLVLNEPYGSDIARGFLYMADRDGGTAENDPSAAVVRWFDLKTGAPAGQVRVPQSPWFNDIEVAADGTIYATQTGDLTGASPDPKTFQLWKVTPAGTASMIVQGAPLFQPNGVALDPQGNVVVVNVGNTDVLTFSPEGKLLKTETSTQAGNDGLVIMSDGTKYISSVRLGGVTRLAPGRPAELLARNVPNPASMCYDSGGGQLAIPMNANNALALLSVRAR